MEINPNESEKGAHQFDKPKETNKGSEASTFIKLTSKSGSELSPEELECHFSELIKNLLSDISKAKNQYTSIQKDYQKNLTEQPGSSRSEQRQFKTNYLEQLNGVIGNLKEAMEEHVSDILESVGVNQPSDDMVHQILQTVKDPRIKEAYTSKFIKDPETPFLSSRQSGPSYQSMFSQTHSQMDKMEVGPSSTPTHTPSTIQDLKDQLSQFGASGGQNVKALVAAVLSEINTLQGKGLSLNSIESWAYAAMVGKFTANSEYSIGLQNLNPSEQATFKIITGIHQFQGVLSTHGFNTAQVTAIAKSFSDGTIPLKDANDQKFIQTFYSNLQAGQNPKAAADNAYKIVPRSSLSQSMQTFIIGIVNPNTPPPPGIKSYPFTYVNNSGKDPDNIYIQIIGTDPKTNLQCFIKYDAQGNPTYIDAAKGLNPNDYSFPLSYFPKSPDGKGYTLNIPELNGGRIYTSIDGKMPCKISWASKISQYLIVPDLSTSLVMEKTEFTIDKGSVFFNPTAVDDFSLPISVEEKGKNGSTQTGGISTVSREKIFDELSQELNSAGGPWPKLMPKIPPIIYSPVDAANIGIFPQDYFQTSGFLDAFSKEFSTHPLQVDAGESFPNTGVFKGTYDPKTGEMTFTGTFKGKETTVVLKIPTTTSGMLLGNGPAWNINPTDPKDIQALKSALARNISVAIDTNTLTTTEPLNKNYFIKHQKDFYKENSAMPDKLQFIDHYSKVLHSITRNIYTFGYDDEAGQSGGCSFTPQNFASGTITLGPLT